MLTIFNALVGCLSSPSNELTQLLAQQLSCGPTFTCFQVTGRLKHKITLQALVKHAMV